MRISQQRTVLTIEPLEFRVLLSVTISYGGGGSGGYELPGFGTTTPQSDLTTEFMRLGGPSANWPMAGAPSQFFSVKLSSKSGVDRASVARDGVVSVAGPSGKLNVAYVGDDGLENPTVYLRVDAPDGKWDGRDSGHYSVTLLPDMAASKTGVKSPESSIGSFDVSYAYFGWDLVSVVSSDKPAVTTVRPGETTRLPVIVANTGNRTAKDIPVGVAVRLVNIDSGESTEVVGKASVKRTTLATAQTKLFNLRIKTPKSLADGVYRFETTVNSSTFDPLDEYNDIDRSGPTVQVQSVVRPVAAPKSAGPAVLEFTYTDFSPSIRGGMVGLKVTVKHISGGAGRYSGQASVDRNSTRFHGKLAPGQISVHRIYLPVPADAAVDAGGNAVLSVNANWLSGVRGVGSSTSSFSQPFPLS